MATRKSRKTASKAGTAARTDPRAPIRPTVAALKRTLTQLRAGLERVEPPAEPQQGDLVDAMLHCILADGAPCGLAQEAARRIEAEFVDRNEFRVTEAYETEELLTDLGFPETFERCRIAKAAVVQVYNDQNGVTLEFLREATVSERKSFFQREPAIPPWAVAYLQNLLAFEEIAFSSKSTLRAQVRVGLDPRAVGVIGFVEELLGVLASYGHVPLLVGPHSEDGKPILEPELCPACLLARLGPPGKR